MSPRIYKTNRWLWFAMSLVCLLLSSYDIQYVFGLVFGDSRFAELFSFEFLAPLIISVAMGWLAQCATVIVFYWIREKRKS